MFGIGRGTLHGEFTVPKQGGGYQTLAVQNGAVTAVSEDSITVKSDDGYTKTYKVTANTWVNATRDGIGSVKTGHDVVVTATVSGDTRTAVSITDLSLAQQLRRQWGPFNRHGKGMPPGQGGQGGGQGSQGGTPSPKSTTT
jgi:hypothetical protein